MTSLIIINKEEFIELLKEQLNLILKTHENDKQILKDTFPSKLYTRKEAAAYLKISPPTLNAWRNLGVIKCQRIQGRVYYLHETLEALVNKSKRK